SSDLGDSKMSVAQHMHDTEKYRQLRETVRQEMVSAESIVRELDMKIRTIESEISLAERGIAGSENVGAELKDRKKKLLERHEMIKSSLDSTQKEVETLERLAADRRNEEAALLTKNSELRERAAILREQIGHQQSSIADMEQSLLLLKQKIAALEVDRELYTEHESGIDLSPEEISSHIERSANEKSSIEKSLSGERELRIEIASALEKQEESLKHLRLNEAKAVSTLN